MRGRAHARTTPSMPSITFVNTATFAGIAEPRPSQAPQCTIRAHFCAYSNLEELWREWKVFSRRFSDRSPGVHSRNVSVVKY